ncbi:unnamed protein product [Schistosoma bovis]|nr:unnamed protein product [Schistosoma bovis]
MDTTNLKRPGSGNYGKINNRSGGGVSHRTVSSHPGHRIHVPSADSDITKPSLSPVCELQYPVDINYSSTKVTDSRSNTECSKDYNEPNVLNCLTSSPSVDTCTATKSMNFYHCSQQANTTHNNNSIPTCINIHWQ